MTETTQISLHPSKKQVTVLMVLAAMAGFAVLPACNTTEGAGKDIKSVGKGIEETAHDAK